MVTNAIMTMQLDFNQFCLTDLNDLVINAMEIDDTLKTEVDQVRSLSRKVCMMHKMDLHELKSYIRHLVKNGLSFDLACFKFDADLLKFCGLNLILTCHAIRIMKFKKYSAWICLLRFIMLVKFCKQASQSKIVPYRVWLVHKQI